METEIGFFMFLLGLIITMFGTLAGAMAMKNGNSAFGLTVLMFSPTVGPALIWTAMT
jgi:hypothetical protein